jgi:hypothetical protein
VKRWLVLLLLTLAVVLLLSPGIIGRLAEKNIDDNLARVDLEIDDITIQAESFRRGWFTSEGRHRILLQGGALLEIAEDFGDDAGTGGTPALIVDTRLDHGLVPLSSMQRERGSLNPGLANAVSTLLFDPGDGEIVELPGKVYSFVDLGGDTSFRYLAEPGSATAGKATTDWQGADIVYTQSADRLERSLSGKLEPASVASFGVTTTLGRIVVEAEQDRRQHLLGAGRLSLEIGSLLVRSPGEPDMVVERAALSAENRVDDGRTSGGVNMAVSVSNLPDVDAVDVELDIDVRDLDADALFVIRETVKTLNQIGAPASEAELRAAYPALQREAQNLAARGGRIDINSARVTLPQGDWRMALSLTVPEDTPAPGQPFSWPSVLLRTEAKLDMRISAGLFEFLVDREPQVRGALASGMLRKAGDGYEMKAELDGGRLIINGAPMNLPIGFPQ